MVLAAFAGTVAPAIAGEWSGYIGGDVRAFSNEAALPRQHDLYPGLVAELEYRDRPPDGSTFAFVPFARIDRYDGERSHTDIRELLWTGRGDGYEWRAGIGRVFWGVTEFYHLVDVVNQADFVEDLDGEAKLGQPMVGLSTERRWGMLEAYVLPGFRERTFPGPEGRLRFSSPVDTEHASFESSKRRAHVDWALRWSATGAGWDIGLSRFEGTNREPRFLPGLDDAGAVVLVPHYDLIEQTGIDAQTTLGNWLWKIEAIKRAGGGERFGAYTGGFEYTFVGVLSGRTDLGMIVEVMHDGRGGRAPHFFQDDMGFGVRVGFNDMQSTQLLVGVVADRDYDTQLWKIEGSRRIGENWRLSVEARRFRRVDVNDVVFGLRQDSYLQLGIARYL